VDIRSFAFPSELHVPVGARVVWTNQDSVLHNVVARDDSWGSELFGLGAAYTRAFPEPGRYTYFCSIHPYMQAAVIVE
jgi:plastocyanin